MKREKTVTAYTCDCCGADYLCMCEAEFCPSCGAKVVE